MFATPIEPTNKASRNSLIRTELLCALASENKLKSLEPLLTIPYHKRSETQLVESRLRLEYFANDLLSNGVVEAPDLIGFRGMRMRLKDFYSELDNELVLTRKFCNMFTFARNLWPAFSYALSPMAHSIDSNEPTLSFVFQVNKEKIKESGIHVTDFGESCRDVFDVWQNIPSRFIEKIFIYYPSERRFLTMI